MPNRALHSSKEAKDGALSVARVSNYWETTRGDFHTWPSSSG